MYLAILCVTVTSAGTAARVPVYHSHMERIHGAPIPPPLRVRLRVWMRDAESMELRPHCRGHPWSSDPWPKTTRQGLAPPLSLSFRFARLGFGLSFPDAFSMAHVCATQCHSGDSFHSRLLPASPPVPPFFFHSGKMVSHRFPPLLCSAPLYLQCLFMFLSPKKGISESEKHVSVL